MGKQVIGELVIGVISNPLDPNYILQAIVPAWFRVQKASGDDRTAIPKI
ncbi:MAG: hypothetical protein JGK26_20475 [Microcoleus sp. PH2017_27_LUM_O_A]|nr:MULTISPECIES: hypothetical protein [unclassified Microcoleus]MCC3480148.1 hypothetical protein [Microcoleus sp. PH2017_12_PCY_D_A]MCC3527997.1 hypothetical protein [Microcoleus sp. PH2017_21_RUC_O_A]MCC3540027.1 hypothetical protein [Microcoleus sp. PH2017_22_RUC_O_B]MCC3460120.1 hypothetical protein [Microcoleus sp. PH2017_11_PCY_U_A]MCC3561464.1 hypothetical protein [Microcoleus sp. PH2017_27_LUM_O_A]